jgi:hypothetical protein
MAPATILIRRPVEEVFNAFVDPNAPTLVWFTRSSGRPAVGERTQLASYRVEIAYEAKRILDRTDRPTQKPIRTGIIQVWKLDPA